MPRKPPPYKSPASTIQEKRSFATFDHENPRIWRMFVLLTLGRIGRGHQHFGAGDVLRQIRWDTMLKENGPSGLKISNAWSPWYARKFQAAYPQHAGFFRIKPAAADNENWAKLVPRKAK